MKWENNSIHFRAWLKRQVDLNEPVFHKKSQFGGLNAQNEAEFKAKNKIEQF